MAKTSNRNRAVMMDKLTNTFGFKAPKDEMISAIKGKITIDIIKLDQLFGEHDPEYDPDECMYKGREEVSMEAYVTAKYGKETAEIIEKLLR